MSKQYFQTINQKKVYYNVVLPILALLLGIFSIYKLLGIENINLSEDDFMISVSQSFLISIVLPFDFTILCCTILVTVIRHVCKKRENQKMGLIKTGWIMCIVCLVISFTELGTFLPGITYGIGSTREGDDRVASDDDYEISDLHVVYDGEYLSMVSGEGILTNTSDYDWESAEVGIRLKHTEGEEEQEEFILTAKFGTVYSGENVKLETACYSRMVRYGSISECDVAYVKYDIDSREKYKNIEQETRGEDIHVALENDYAISDLHVDYNGDYYCMVRGEGIITNTSGYDWETVEVNIKMKKTTNNGEEKEFVLSTELREVLSGESVEFKTDYYYSDGMVKYGSISECEIESVYYKY
ncbi:MAG: hypothetical protein K2K21_12100 [Lachnospiraceae bacterium]|nr:hypothetical protein [Lachnospiraceae bacterium]